LTLALAIRCRDGIVLAADSQSTLLTAGQWTRLDADKLNVLGGRVAWAGSGAIGAVQRVELELEAHAREILAAFAVSHELGAREVFRRVNTVQKQVFTEAVGDPTNVGSSYLFAGYGVAGPFLLEIDSDGGRQWSDRHSFAAIGSGAIYAIHASRSIAHHRLPALSLVQAQALAYRTVENAIATAALGLGGATRLLVVTPSGAGLLDRTELKAVQDIVDIWKQREVEILLELGAAAEDPSAQPGAPLPEPPSE
jgi:20S proteasome alpha/beta subunit